MRASVSLLCAATLLCAALAGCSGGEAAERRVPARAAGTAEPRSAVPASLVGGAVISAADLAPEPRTPAIAAARVPPDPEPSSDAASPEGPSEDTGVAAVPLPPEVTKGLALGPFGPDFGPMSELGIALDLRPDPQLPSLLGDAAGDASLMDPELPLPAIGSLEVEAEAELGFQAAPASLFEPLR